MRRTLLFAMASIALLASALLGPLKQQAAALPTFAQAYHMDCSACHTMVPALNAYGRFVQSTAYGALDASVMKKVIPIVVRESVSYRSTAKLDKLRPQDRFTTANLSVNLVGLLNQNVSFRLEQSLYSNDLGGGSTSHFWVADNQLFKGNGHLIVGKFDLPGPPAFSYWQDMSGFSGSSIAVGQHGYNLGGTRWGVGFNYVPTDYKHTPFKFQLAYVGNSPAMINSSAFDTSNPYAPGGAGSDKTFVYKAAWARPDNPVEAGIYGAAGTYILSNGFIQPIDKYSSLGGYAQRDPTKGVPGIMVFYQQTHDSNVGPGKASQGLAQSATSWSGAIEFQESLLKGDVMLGIRPVEYDGGLQPSKKGYDILTTAHPHFGVFDIVARDPKFTPYLWVTLEAAVAAASNAANGLPTWRAGLKWASPVGPAPK